MARPDLGEKDILNPEEAIRYWNFSRRKFYQFLEQYLYKNPKVKEELANGRSRKRED